ncbi:hypothetical protein AC249_AIPGENE20330 [Exaiptasia diaphana]|nr:hypothetical protein AC249_AIPGENE20330 [Exaiptasia diaphana]
MQVDTGIESFRNHLASVILRCEDRRVYKHCKQIKRGGFMRIRKKNHFPNHNLLKNHVKVKLAPSECLVQQGFSSA